MTPTTAVHVEDATFQQFESLRRNRSKRTRQRVFLIEGVRQIDMALAHDWPLEALLYAHDREPSRWALGILAASPAAAHYSFPLRLLTRISGRRDPPELIAVAAMPDDDPDRIRPGDVPLLVVLDRPGNAANLGAIVRSCDALGADGLVVTGHAADPYAPEAVAASSGSLFALPVVRMASASQLWHRIEHLRGGGVDLQLIGTSIGGERALSQVDFRRGTVLLIGNEIKGLSHAYRRAADSVAVIPRYDSTTSLDSACAASIALYEVRRQRAL